MEQLPFDRGDRGRSLPGRQGEKMGLNGLGELNRVRHQYSR
jgi:hypothetical protein